MGRRSCLCRTGSTIETQEVVGHHPSLQEKALLRLWLRSRWNETGRIRRPANQLSPHFRCETQFGQPAGFFLAANSSIRAHVVRCRRTLC